jgi:hypothetical protein
VVVAAGSKTGYALSATGLNAITLTEPAGKPSWGSTTLTAWFAFLGAWSRNKVTSTATTVTLRNDADNADIVTITHSDDTAEFVSGEVT